MIKFFFFWAKMTTKFNQGMYARIKAKKNELLFSIGQRKVQVVQKETIEKTSFTPTPNETRVASLADSFEEITPHPKKRRLEIKGRRNLELASEMTLGQL